MHTICFASKAVLWIRQYFLRIRIRGSVILNKGSGSGSPIIYGSESYLATIFMAIEKILLTNRNR
jgi:hypothetical protein